MTTVKFISVAVLAAALPVFAQVSAFDAGNLNSENPYGLTENEKELLKNKRSVQSMQGDLSSLSEQIQGLQSVVEGMNSRMAKIEQRLSDLEIRVNGDTSMGVETGDTLATLRKSIDETQATQKSNYEEIKNALSKLAGLIDKKASSQTNVSKKNTANKAAESPKVNLSSTDNKSLINEAIQLFNNKKDSEAKAYFEHLISKNFMPATSNYYLGEIQYRQKNYSNAIKYYQASVAKDDQASYMPRLLYHTGISFDKVGDTASANRFYKALKIGYPNTNEAKTAPNRD
ncbi:MAG: tetratricopeptide repeat protein [Campylobacter sp.]|nr:tetratricopeptide repeat protein [Campylobacter sp.]